MPHPADASSYPAPDRPAAPFEAWLALDAEICALQARFGADEAGHARSGGALTALPAPLRALDARILALSEIRERTLPGLAARPAATAKALAAKLAIAARLVAAEDHPDAHALISGALSEMAALTRFSAPGSWRR